MFYVHDIKEIEINMIMNSRPESLSKTVLFWPAFQRLPQNVQQKIEKHRKRWTNDTRNLQVSLQASSPGRCGPEELSRKLPPSVPFMFLAKKNRKLYKVAKVKFAYCMSRVI